jgi:S-adenosyl-L-methionine hydrolase (adenosine-forming)
MRPIVALLTDFGTRDPYAGAIRGAVLAACPEATVVDVSHDLPAHDVAEAAFCLVAAYRAFPGGTVFVAVVDPGVGGPRRGVAVEAGGYRFVGPDNGLFSLVLAEHPEARVRELTNRGLFRYEVSRTFHGRDVFAPVAGHLARGTPFEEVGPEVGDPVALPARPIRGTGPGEWEASVIHVDRFGNLTTNVSALEFETVLASLEGDPTRVVVRVGDAVLPVVNTYSEIPEGEACALLGSSGRLEVAVNRGSAARSLGSGKGSLVRILRVPAARATLVTVL